MHSATSTSASLPVAITRDRPMPRSVAMPYVAEPKAPLCVARPITPCFGRRPLSAVEKVA
ncbi:hypothetical protein D9M68_982370 [compost metagenome]